MSPPERADLPPDLPPDFCRLLATWRALRELECSGDEIRHGLSYPEGDFERGVLRQRAGPQKPVWAVA